MGDSRTLGCMPGHPQVLVGCFGALLWLWFATTDSDWRCRRLLIRLSRILGGAGAGVRISHTTGCTRTVQSERDVRLRASLPLVKCCVFRSPLTVSFSVTAVLAFLAMPCFRLYLGSVCETRVWGSCFYDFLTLHNESCISAILAICICCYWGVRAWNFPATAVYISRGGFLASLLVKGILRVFTVLLGLSKAISIRFLVRRKLRFRLPGGIDRLYTGVLGALSRRWMFVSRALRGTASTFGAGVLLAGPDPVPQLPVNMSHRWSIRLQNTQHCEQETVQRMFRFMCPSFNIQTGQAANYLCFDWTAHWVLRWLLCGAFTVWLWSWATLWVAGAGRLNPSGMYFFKWSIARTQKHNNMRQLCYNWITNIMAYVPRLCWLTVWMANITHFVNFTNVSGTATKFNQWLNWQNKYNFDKCFIHSITNSKQLPFLSF